ncbi:MAG TPA: DsbA family oxidoreductase [Pseudonocardiaceae bacterium]|nr:DsbA family oxidoreductase [Pseudonocardiaceae bacterium]
METAEQAPTRLSIDVWSDIVCPFCYLGEHRLSQAIARSPHADRIDLRIHTFHLDPTLPASPIATLEVLSAKHGLPAAQARTMEDGLARQARAEGLPYEVDRPAANTFDMLRLVQLGSVHGVGWEVMRDLQAEVFSANPDAYTPATLTRVAENLGIPEKEIHEVLAGDKYADAVRADHEQAVRLGARGVPFTVLGERLGIPGAVEADQFLAAIDQAWEQIHG